MSTRILACVLGALFAFTAVQTDAVAAKAKASAKKERRHHSSSSSSSSSSEGSCCDCGC